MQRLEGLMRKAMQQYEMISPGDRVAVGVSGGKDFSNALFRKTGRFFCASCFFFLRDML